MNINKMKSFIDKFAYRIGIFCACIWVLGGCFILSLGLIWQGYGFIMLSLYMVIMIHARMIIEGFNDAMEKQNKISEELLKHLSKSAEQEKPEGKLESEN